MKIEIAKEERMSESGSSLLRLIQNNGTPTLDLFVRESFQNSLDAGNNKDADNSESVDIDIHTGTFESEKLAPEFENISDRLKEKYPGTRTFISVGDKHTSGLTGPVRYEDVEDGHYGNLLKLVYEISKPQENEGSGGSWGLGKTIYYRVGIGLVIFYSRISVDGTYQNRLAATLIEDERKPDKLLPKTKYDRGIAWWGQTDSKAPDRTVPVTDTQTIAGILNVFGLSPYEGSDTGTVVIIPYTDESALLKETISLSEYTDENNDNGKEYIPAWKKNGVAEYLKIAAQRWYAPRLNNKAYNARYFDETNKSKYLRLWINSGRLRTKEMVPFFLLIQKLYNARPGDESEFNGKEIYSESIKLRNIFDMESQNSDAGRISYAEVTDEDLRMLPPYNYDSPFQYINHETDPAFNAPIIMFTRLPGMIVNYEVSGDWTNGISNAEKGKYIVGLFIPESSKKIRETHMSLEEYLRNSEKADHMNWHDWVDGDHGGKRLPIISRIQKQCAKRIREKFIKQDSENTAVKNAGLGRLLAGLLMPPVGFAGWDNGSGGGSGEGGTGGKTGTSQTGKDAPVRISNNVSMRVLSDPEFRGHNAYLHVFLSFGKLHSGIIRVLVSSENGMINPKSWHKTVGSRFPVVLNSLTISKIVRGKQKRETIYEGEYLINRNQNFHGFDFDFNETNNFERCELTIKSPEKEYFGIDGFICYTIDPESHVSGRIVFEKTENGDDD